MLTIIREIRSIPPQLLKEYLQELGGTLVAEDHVQGPGWSVRLEAMEPFQLGSLVVGQTRLIMDFDGDEIAQHFLERFALKTMRAGG